MVDFSSNRYMLGNHASWSSRFATEDAQAHEAWARNEERRRYGESTSLAREAAGLEAQIQQGQAGLFSESDLGGLTRAAPTASGPMSLTPPANANAGGAAATAAPMAPVQSGTPINMSGPDVLRVTPVTVPQLTQQQRDAWARYVTARGGGPNDTRRTTVNTIRGAGPRGQNPEAEAQALAELRSLGLDMRNGQLVYATPAYSAEAMRFDAPQTANQAGIQPTSVPEANVNLDMETSPAGVTGLAGAESSTVPMGQTFEGINDTTRPLQPTREMRMAAAVVDADRRRAELYARHGRPDLAQEAFARSLQGQANLITAERTVLYRAAANGSFGAMSRLMEVYNGYPRGTVRMSPTGPNNSAINVEYQMQDGSWVSHGRALTRDQVLGGLLNLVDAEGAAARSESNQEYMIAVLNNQTDLAEAGIEAQTAQLRMFTDLQVAQMNNDLRRAIAEGQATVVNNDDTGETRIFYPRIVNGRTTWEMESITMETQRSPDTQGQREVQVPVRRRVTGNVGAN